MPPVAQDGAYARVTAHARESAVALGLDLAELTPAYAQTMEEDPLDGRVFVAAKWWLPAETQCGPAFEGLARHWRASGYRLIGDGRGDVLPYLWAEDPADGYRLGLEGNVQGRLVLGASSPLFWPDGTAADNGFGAAPGNGFGAAPGNGFGTAPGNGAGAVG